MLEINIYVVGNLENTENLKITLQYTHILDKLRPDDLYHSLYFNVSLQIISHVTNQSSKTLFTDAQQSIISISVLVTCQNLSNHNSNSGH